MNPEKIRFNCPSCGIQLDVPAALAGVTGPCPSCQSSITAPHPEIPTPAPPQQPVPQQPVPQQQPPQQYVPQPAEPPQPASLPPQEYTYHTEPVPAQNYAEPEPATYQPEPATQNPAGQNVFPTVVPEPVQPEVHPTPDEAPFPIEPTPTADIPSQRSSDGHASQSPDSVPASASASSGREQTPTKQGSRLPSIIFLILFLIVASILVTTLLSAMGAVGIPDFKSFLGFGKKPAAEVTKPDPADHASAPDSAPLTPPEKTPPAPQESAPPKLSPAKTLNVPSIVPEPSETLSPPRLPEGQNYREGESPLPAGLSATSNDPRQVQKILTSFLQAESLSEREAYMSAKKIDNTTLITSPLIGPIPKPTSTLFLDVFTDEQEKRTDFFYVVSWAGENNTPTKPMTVELHKWPGSEPPRIHTEAFLEFYQQKLARYASEPLDRPARFYVLAECVAKCFETDTVPDHATKATLKLGSFPNDRSPIKAYLNKKGEILESLKTYRNGLAFRKAIPLTITLGWSEPIDGQRYLEVRIIDSFDWHP